jgi:hypothetical protein
VQYGVSTTMAPSHKQWIIPFAIQLIPSALLFFGSFWLHESPRWLMSKGKREQAVKNLCWIRKLNEDDLYIKEEMYAIDANIERQMEAGESNSLRHSLMHFDCKILELFDFI